MNKLSQNFLLIIAACIAMFAGLWLAQNNNKTELQPPSIQGAIYPQAKVINEFSLLDHRGDEFTQQQFVGHWSLIFVGYTHCPDVCPTTMALLHEVRQMMVDQTITSPNIVFLSIDPERDTADVMKNYVEYFDAEFTGVTGELNEVASFSRNINAVFQKAPGLNGTMDDDNYLMDHSSALMLVNPQGKLQSILTAPHSTVSVADSIIKSQAYFESVN